LTLLLEKTLPDVTDNKKDSNKNEVDVLAHCRSVHNISYVGNGQKVVNNVANRRSVIES